jgi:NAD(P)-dependent dehydrogenase (short-subunit alcohol dehydrogenase family)
MINNKLLKTNLNNRNILITGASGNLGKNFYKYLDTLGANLIICDVDNDKKIPPLKKNHFFFKLDVTKKKQWINLKKKLHKKKIFIDTLINCAGYTNHSNKKNFSNNVFDIEPDHLKKVFDVNTFGLIYGCLVFGEPMIKRKKGCIVNIASMYGIQSPRHHIYKNTNIKSPLAYSASKSSVIAITKYLGTLWGSDGVRVNSISPGGIKDKTHKKIWLKKYGENNPLKRMATNEEMMNALIYLISESSSYTNASNIVVDGGWTSW